MCKNMFPFYYVLPLVIFSTQSAMLSYCWHDCFLWWEQSMKNVSAIPFISSHLRMLEILQFLFVWIWEEKIMMQSFRLNLICGSMCRTYVRLLPSIAIAFCANLMKWRKRQHFRFLWSTSKDITSSYVLLYISIHNEMHFLQGPLLIVALVIGWKQDQSCIV